jgi:CYTH domain-containing protein
MPLEIERKFLVQRKQLPSLEGGKTLRQGYLSFGPVAVRVRAQCVKPYMGWLTVKGPGKLSRSEFEYPIPYLDAQELLEMCQATLLKVRYRVPVGDHVWDLDIFHGNHTGLALAEVELKSEGETFHLPPWVGEEVTYDSRYSNANLAKNGLPPQSG